MTNRRNQKRADRTSGGEPALRDGRTSKRTIAEDGWEDDDDRESVDDFDDASWMRTRMSSF